MGFKNREPLIVANFGELWLKGRNRNEYIAQLQRNIKDQLDGESFLMERHFDRLIFRLYDDSDVPSIAMKLKRTFGLSKVETSVAVKPDMRSISAAAGKLLSVKPSPKSVRINAHRAYKQLTFTSSDIVQKLKGVAEKNGVDPASKGAEKEINISVTKEAAFLSMGKERGIGGLPVGSSGSAVVLLSGGIDSPVAAWYAMKRGLTPIYVHVHSLQNADEAMKSKIPRLIGTLSAFHPHYKAYFVPSHVFQAASIGLGKYELVVMKAFFLRLAEQVALKEGAHAIYTGESLGQVASQTSQNIEAEQYGVKVSVLRPLIGFDKEEIIKVARTIGTYDQSIEQYKDVCSINAKNPKLNSESKVVARILKKIGIGSVVKRSIKASKIVIA
jgi:thiamine biosynthesis protein ThiI